MEQDDGLWPPFGPAAAFREQLGRGRGRPGDAHHRPDRGRSDARAPGNQRGRSRQGSGLSREEIVDVAIAVADSEGAESVSMRKIAQVLRAGAMSLYWHLASKEHLLELMLDALMADVVVPEPTGDWQEDLRVQARSQRQVLLRHKWVINFIAARPPLGPNTLRNLDKSLATLDCLDIDTDTALNILQSVNTYVLGAVVRELGELRIQGEQEKWVTSGSDINAKMQQWRARLEE